MIKAKLYAILAGIFAVLLTTIKILSGQNRRNKKRAERAEAKVLFQEKVVDRPGSAVTNGVSAPRGCLRLTAVSGTASAVKNSCPVVPPEPSGSFPPSGPPFQDASRCFFCS